mmetsp:Transcript_39536/g.102355  ORF Transcript_39536/g.102355 Transcript_39536/m.102355 type:complete len:205 (+) Transcript_39536:336-950(+)
MQVQEQPEGLLARSHRTLPRITVVSQVHEGHLQQTLGEGGLVKYPRTARRLGRRGSTDTRRRSAREDGVHDVIVELANHLRLANLVEHGDKFIVGDVTVIVQVQHVEGALDRQRRARVSLHLQVDVHLPGQLGIGDRATAIRVHLTEKLTRGHVPLFQQLPDLAEEDARIRLLPGHLREVLEEASGSSVQALPLLAHSSQGHVQ